MTVSLTFLVAFFVVYLVFKGFLFYRLNVALRRMEQKQKSLANLSAFDATRQHDDASGPPRALEL
jgi:uncharacterized membrane protein YciS (DUF1049 family)